MKTIFISMILLCTLYSQTVTCKNEIAEDTFYAFEQKAGYSLLVNEGEYDEEYDSIIGEIDPTDAPIVYYDDTSAICGGTENHNKMVTAYCDWNIDKCYDVKVGVSGFEAIIKQDGKYTNNVIFKGVYPCLPYGIDNVTVGFYDYDKNDIALANFFLTDIEDERIFPLTQEEADKQRSQCAGIEKYIDDWENLLDSQNANLNKNITSIDSIIERDYENPYKPKYDGITENFEVNPNVSNDLDSFKTNVKTSITNSFDNYSNAFGFGGYANAPSPIILDLYGKSFTVFDVSLFDSAIPTVRTLFASFAYIWGSILVVRSLA